MTHREQIRSKAVSLLEARPEGLRFGELRNQLRAALPDIPPNTISGNLVALSERFPEQVVRPARGLFLHTKFHEPVPSTSSTTSLLASQQTAGSGKIREDDFYAPFADWLETGLEECTKAIAVGGNRFRDKWGTPDVVGIRDASEERYRQVPD